MIVIDEAPSRVWQWIPPGVRKFAKPALAKPPRKRLSLLRGKRARALGGQFVLRLRIEVAGSMAFMQLLSRIADGAIDHSAALNGRSLGNHLGPANDVNVFL